jgi:hypothetical protein
MLMFLLLVAGVVAEGGMLLLQHLGVAVAALFLYRPYLLVEFPLFIIALEPVVTGQPQTAQAEERAVKVG